MILQLTGVRKSVCDFVNIVPVILQYMIHIYDSKIACMSAEYQIDIKEGCLSYGLTTKPIPQYTILRRSQIQRSCR